MTIIQKNWVLKYLMYYYIHFWETVKKPTLLKAELNRRCKISTSNPVTVDDIKICTGSKFIAPFILYLETRWSWIKFQPRLIYPRGKWSMHPLTSRMCDVDFRAIMNALEKRKISWPYPSSQLYSPQPRYWANPTIHKFDSSPITAQPSENDIQEIPRNIIILYNFIKFYEFFSTG